MGSVRPVETPMIEDVNVTSTKRGPQIDAILNIDKPYGMTSMEVVRRLKRASGVRRLGHGGTLDPIASGVVPICFGQATRVMEYLIEGTKHYRATIELGVTTDTYDALGKKTAEEDFSHVTLADIKSSLDPFRGDVDQIPPMYSALKRQGKRLYDLARAGIEVERAPRRVKVFSIDLMDWSPPLVTLEVRCGRGFYMRSLAHDLGQVLGCGGHVKNLVRLRSGPFQISEAIPLSDAELRLQHDTLSEDFYAPDVVLQEMRAAVVGRRVENMIKHGRELPPGLHTESSRPNEPCRVYTVDGRFLAVITFDASARRWQPEKVFSLGYPESVPPQQMEE